MKQQLIVVLLAFILSIVSFGRQIYDSDILCLDTDETCTDDGYVFKDSDPELEDEPREPLYPGYYMPEIEDGFEFSSLLGIETSREYFSDH